MQVYGKLWCWILLRLIKSQGWAADLNINDITQWPCTVSVLYYRCCNFLLRQNMWLNSIIIMSWSPAEEPRPANLCLFAMDPKNWEMQMQTMHFHPTWIIWQLQYLYKYSLVLLFKHIVQPFEELSKQCYNPQHLDWQLKCEKRKLQKCKLWLDVQNK